MSIRAVLASLNDPRDRRCVRIVCVALIAFELALCAVIIAKVAYTEIDWIAYMEEVHGYARGERDYTKLKGGTGPLVYPAGFVYAYKALYDLVGGLERGTSARGVATAQVVFALVYAAHQALVFSMYAMCEIIPPWAYALLCLSKRVHSIFVLRMFNDGVAMALAYGATTLFQRKRWIAGSVVFSLGVSVKMNVLLMLPGLLVLLVGGTSAGTAIGAVAAIVGTQIALGAPFLATYPREYLSRAFELGRVFTHKWSVNFKFVSEDIFVSKSFAKYLLLAHLVCLFVFAHRRWCAREGGFFFNFVRDFFKRLLLRNVDGVQSTFTPAHVALVLAQSNLIGIVFARSLHYQFYSWYFHTIPLLLWSNPRVPVGAKLAIMGAIEWCWNVYPSTPTSSKIFVVIHLGVLAVAYAAPTASRRGKQKSA
ncbi:predicted protein [Ostreococcus lucimarinus CCE9901]|jgi:alpha-1,3-mannosyltransferase|uniref:dolichyl-P-Man:Man5GlcNAc2-PP-dolichol alpha-1,3-mannosyltransferase n=1 Tax=Ostreococcus lucimarinus (strain CCE9901) TaxID=436017 RepID=A4S939_OSTLU|nr:predicted protein [Ostreococcus lucimarinus CCE9901]ABP00161.1 predicted protein [Ostreococcus lucimarinus CCE9901]|tara:strand:+ start:1977 stop:3245 length:1269 start_codon:yes stop_codon:yes gene_type:complete|eukprot:XP_001421867.1 predicted protein [Ostreococcus lucimarinus CCE9901]